jgi:hypothetical protein
MQINKRKKLNISGLVEIKSTVFLNPLIANPLMFMAIGGHYSDTCDE